MLDSATMTTTLAQVDVEGAVSDSLRSVANFVPKFVAFLVILLIGWLVARALRALVKKVLEQVGFDRAVERGGIAQVLSNTRYDAVGLIAALGYYAVLLFTLQLAFGVFGPNAVSDLIAGIVAWLPKAIVAIVIIVVAALIARVVREIIEGAIGGLSYGPLLARVTAWFIIGLGVIAALNQVGIATTVATPVLIALLAMIAGVVVVGVGGGLVKPMQQRWEGWLDRAALESARISSDGQESADDVARRQRDGSATEPSYRQR